MTVPPTPPQPIFTPASAPARSAPPAAAQQPQGGIKDTIESILIAFILAFIFRAFVVEAFVIPTGSMAPTLLGAHIRYTCEDCGYSFTVNYSSRNPGGGDDIVIPSTTEHAYDKYPVFCPNCLSEISKKQTTNPPVHYGDRILVLKYLYLLEEPKRWDVVVFKNPHDLSKAYTTNYIKRLIGRPGESILLMDGDVYVAPAGSTDIHDYKVQTKPRYAQEALWRIVYDNDFYPRRPGWRNPWTAVGDATGWDLGHDPVTGRTFHFSGSGAGTIEFDAKANTIRGGGDVMIAPALTDWLGYDQVERLGGMAGEKETNVSDVKLSTFYTREQGDGPVRLHLSKQDTYFTAELTPTSVRLVKRVGKDGAETEIGRAEVSLPVGKTTHIEFTNVDYRVALRVDNHDLIVTTPEQYAPNPAVLLQNFPAANLAEDFYPKPTIQIEAAGQKARFEHLSLWRDVYYTTRVSTMRHAIPRDFPGTVLTLSNTPGKEEYFVCGDNSPMSFDARYWTQPVSLPAEDLEVEDGRVPARFMLGKAFFVYWPAGYRPMDSAPGIIPNFAAMRFIH